MLTHTLADKLKDIEAVPKKSIAEEKAELQEKYQAVLSKLAAKEFKIIEDTESSDSESDDSVGSWTIKSEN